MKRLSEAEVLGRLRRIVSEARYQRDVARKLGISEQTLSDTLATGRLFPRLTKAMGLRRVVLYERDAA